jgi:sugar fermentation stimulation protein A
MKNTPTGVYILVMALHEGKVVDIGSLGRHTLAPGFYTYTGSAMGGIMQRVSRYLSPISRSHWHIDDLVRNARLERILFLPSRERLECRINTAIQQRIEPIVPIPGFGSSDCRCTTHLFRYDEYPLRSLRKILGSRTLD